MKNNFIKKATTAMLPLGIAIGMAAAQPVAAYYAGRSMYARAGREIGLTVPVSVLAPELDSDAGAPVCLSSILEDPVASFLAHSYLAFLFRSMPLCYFNCSDTKRAPWA